MSGFTYNNIDIAPPVGSITSYTGITDPPGWLICDGRAFSRTTYLKLYNVIGTVYGIGDGSTTFNIPNLLNKFIRGAPTTTTINNTGGGADTFTLTNSYMPAHTHGLGNHIHNLNHTHSLNGHTHNINHTHTYYDACTTENTGGGSGLIGRTGGDSNNSPIYRKNNNNGQSAYRDDTTRLYVDSTSAQTSGAPSNNSTSTSLIFTSSGPNNNTSDSTGGNTSFNTIPYSLGMTFIIKI